MNNGLLGFIGGTALEHWPGLHNRREQRFETPFGMPSAPLVFGEFNGVNLVFLNRHGAAHDIPPHRINYRANIHAMREAGVTRLVGLASVGGISQTMAPGVLLAPNQLIDYSWGRESSFFDADFSVEKHIDFTHPYNQEARQWLLNAAKRTGESLYDGGVYGITQGPRLETSAEIRRMARDGCDVVGMTGMPEAALARELDIEYACCAMVVNWAAGVTDEIITIDDIRRVITSSNERLMSILLAACTIQFKE